MINVYVDEAKLSDFLKVALQAAEAASRIVKHYWGRLSHIEEKGSPGNLVTEADRESEACIKKILEAHFPDHDILGEETGRKRLSNSPFLWAVDPIDGTTNYSHNFPMVAISIALLFHDKPLLGVIYNPILNEHFVAAKGRGATLNGIKIHVSDTKKLSLSLLATGFPYDRHETTETNYEEFCHMTHLTQGVRRLGSAALDLAYTAAGRLDGYWERGLGIWDMAAGVILVEEAGGKVSGWDMSPHSLTSGKILATNGHIHSLLSEELMYVRKMKK